MSYIKELEANLERTGDNNRFIPSAKFRTADVLYIRTSVHGSTAFNIGDILRIDKSDIDECFNSAPYCTNQNGTKGHSNYYKMRPFMGVK